MLPMLPVPDEFLNRIQSFIDDMNRIGVRVIGVNSEGTRIRIFLDTRPEKASEETKGGDGDDKKADTQS